MPHGSTVLEPGDVVLTLVNPSNVKEVQARLSEPRIETETARQKIGD